MGGQKGLELVGGQKGQEVVGGQKGKVMRRQTGEEVARQEVEEVKRKKGEEVGRQKGEEVGRQNGEEMGRQKEEDIIIIIAIIINPLTARVVGAPQKILQPVFSIFPCSPLPSGNCRTPGLSIP